MKSDYVCVACGAHFPLDAAIWRCSKCGGVIDLPEPDAFAESDLAIDEPGLWRYAAAMPPLPSQARVRLGEVMTPLVGNERLGASLKVDYLLPSGSYKDRGSAVLISRLRAVKERDIRDALVMLVRMGYYVEPTSAVAAAGLLRLRDGGQISRESSGVVVVLTGTRLKAGRRVAEVIEGATPSIVHMGGGGSTDA